MSDQRRYYASGVKEALFRLSRGRCYEPTCQERVLRLIDGEPIVNVHITHICAHSDNGPRFDGDMTSNDRRSFSNLILLCQAHHTPVDRKSNEKKYPKELLLRWKRDREGDLAVQLNGLPGLDDDKLQDMMAAVVIETKNDIAVAIDELATISSDTADTLRALVAETFDRPYLDLDAVASLADSARMLIHLEYNASILHESARMLTGLEDHSSALRQILGGLEDNTASFHAAADSLATPGLSALEVATQRLSNLSPELAGLEETVSRMERAAESLEDYNPVIQIDDPQRWRFFLWGVGIGALVIVAVVVLIVTQVGP